MMGWIKEKEGKKGKGGDIKREGWTGGMSMDIEKEKKKKERWEKERRERKRKERCLEQTNNLTHDDCMIDCMNDEQDSSEDGKSLF